MSLEVPVVKANEGAVAMSLTRKAAFVGFFRKRCKGFALRPVASARTITFLIPCQNAPALPAATAGPTRGLGTQLADG